MKSVHKTIHGFQVFITLDKKILKLKISTSELNSIPSTSNRLGLLQIILNKDSLLNYIEDSLLDYIEDSLKN